MDLAVKWRETLENPFLKNLPFKVELNKYGKILMSPASNKHGILQYKTAEKIEDNLPNGVIIIECSILTRDGVKVADVAWASNEFMAEFGEVTPFPKSPEICVEIVSPSNSKTEMEEKTGSYLEKGALEVWIISENKTIKFYNHIGEIESSKFVKNFSL